MQDQILDALRKVIDPDLQRDIVALGFIKDLTVQDGAVSFSIELTTPACPVREIMKEQARQHVMAVPGVKQVDIKMTSRVRPTTSQQREELIPKVRNIVPIASGKGGVGKSTVSVNLAVALARLGAKVGLMDADVYGPSIPKLLGVTAEQPETGKFIPPEAHGVKVVSMGFFMPPGEAVIWRGPMLHKAVQQFLGQVEWGELDYLIVDLPPGTGDIQLSLCQLIPLTGAAVVSTPQEVALGVADKAVIMFDKLHTPILGMVENMSGFACSKCGHREDIFGEGGAQRYALERGFPFLGGIPLSTDIRTNSDAGTPIVAAAPDTPAAKAFLKVAENLAAQVSVRAAGSPGLERVIPREILKPSPDVVLIRWTDGRETPFNCHDLRLNCPCADCVDETTGTRKIAPESIPADISPEAINPVGRYALGITWSDGHSTGIYTFDHLLKLSS